jgi:hypothetical protein
MNKWSKSDSVLDPLFMRVREGFVSACFPPAARREAEPGLALALMEKRLRIGLTGMVTWE